MTLQEKSKVEIQTLVNILMSADSMNTLIKILQSTGTNYYIKQKDNLVKYNYMIMEAISEKISNSNDIIIEDIYIKHTDRNNVLNICTKTFVIDCIQASKEFHAYILCLCFNYDFLIKTENLSEQSSQLMTRQKKSDRKVTYVDYCKRIDANILRIRYKEILNSYADYIIITLLDRKCKIVNKYFKTQRGKCFEKYFGNHPQLSIMNGEKMVNDYAIYKELYITDIDGLCDEYVEFEPPVEIMDALKQKNYFCLNKICSVFIQWIFHYNQTTLLNALNKNLDLNFHLMCNHLMAEKNYSKVFTKFMNFYKNKKSSLYSLYYLEEATGLLSAHLAAYEIDKSFTKKQIEINKESIFDYYFFLAHSVSKRIPFTTLIVMIKLGFSFEDLNNEYIKYSSLYVDKLTDIVYEKLNSEVTPYSKLTTRPVNFGKITRDLNLYFLLANASENTIYYKMLTDGIKKHNGLNERFLQYYCNKL